MLSISVTTVYRSPIDLAGSLGRHAGSRQPAFRAWADCLLIRLAERAGSPKLSTVVARPVLAIASLSADEPDARPVEVPVSECFLAFRSRELRPFRADGWRALVDHLVDSRFDKDMVLEHVLPCDAPRAMVMTPLIREAVSETEPHLLAAIEAYFEDDLMIYLESWTPFAEDEVVGVKARDREVLLSAAALREAS